MCGIAGIYNYKTKTRAHDKTVVSILQSMRYRGPDHLGMYVHDDIAIGNVRLTVQGISETGNQPIYNEDKSVLVVYSGEIYNFPELKDRLEKRGHSFYTSTDTEALVHLYEEYGNDMARDLNGMFAFALFDIRKRALLLGRDRSAQKPLYINRNKNGILFSSELKTVLPYLDRRSLKPAAVETYLGLGYALEPETIVEGVETADPGSIHVFSHSGDHTRKYWKAELDPSRMIHGMDEWKERANVVFKSAVRRHLVSDVPIALLLSGGVDSSLISVLLREEQVRTKAYSGSFVDYPDHDEYAFAANVGHYCGHEVERVSLTNKLMADTLEEFLSRASMPNGDYSGIATYCVAKEISKEYKVIMGGDGGDELFGGYPTYVLPYLFRKYSFVPGALIRLARAITARYMDKRHYLSVPFRLQQLSLAWGENTINAHLLAKQFMPGPLSAEILDRTYFGDAHADGRAASVFKDYYDRSACTAAVSRLCWVDFSTSFRSGMLPKIERNAMLCSIEARSPYLDNEVLDLSLHTDASLMVKGLETKRCLHALLKDKLSGRFEANPRKQGFSPPLVAMFENELRSWREHWLNYRTPLFKPDLFKVLSTWRSKGWDLHRLEWNVCVLSDWCYRNGVL